MTPITEDSHPEHDRHLRIAVSGGPDHSKSSTVGVLVTGTLDNGNGSARSHVLKLPHERDSGRSSSVSYNYIKQVMPDGGRRILTMIDLCGHERYMRTTMYGITAHPVDYGMVMVGANMGINRADNGSFARSITYEHINIFHQMQIPFFIVVSKRDLCTGPVTDCDCSSKQCPCRTELARNPEYVKTRKDVNDLLRSLQYQPQWVDSITVDSDLEQRTAKLVHLMSTAHTSIPVIVASDLRSTTHDRTDARGCHILC